MRNFALSSAGVALVGSFLACGGTKNAGDGGIKDSGGGTSPVAGGGPGGVGGSGVGGVSGGGAQGTGGVTTSTADASADPGAGGAGDFRARYSDAFCRFFVRCGVSQSAATCKTDYIDTGGFNLLALLQDVDSGKTIYDPSKAGPCFDAMVNEPCLLSGAADTGAVDAACAGVLKGTVAAGGNCVADTECAAGVCHQRSCSTSCCLGTCGQPFPIGSACFASSDCVPDAECFPDYVSSGGQRTCQLAVGQGQPCPLGTACQSGLTCDSAGAATCVPYVKDGEACTENGPECENLNSFCDLQSGKCRPRLALGSACSVPAGYLSRPGAGCVFYADCVSGTCVALPGTGEACTVPDGSSASQVCRAGTCTNGTCQAVLAPLCTLDAATASDAGVHN